MVIERRVFQFIVQARIYAVSHLLPVTGRLTLHPDVGQRCYYNLVVLPDPKNMGIAMDFRCYRVYKLRSTLRHFYFRLMAAILDFTFILQSDWVLISAILPENMGIAIWIPLLSCVYAEIRVLAFWEPPSGISDFRLHLTVLPTAQLKSLTQKILG